MAIRTTTTVICDICEKKTDDTGRYTITWDDKKVEVDLCTQHRRPLLDVISKVGDPVPVGVSAALTAAKRVTSRPTKAGARKSPAKQRVATKPSASAVRAWAASNGVEVNPKGMVPKAVVAQFQEAGN